MVSHFKLEATSEWSNLLPESFGGEVLLRILGGGVPPGLPNTDPISDQKCNFPHPFSDLAFTPAFRQKLFHHYLD